jgi:hypothetical protein
VSTNKSSFHHFKYIFPIKRYGSTANWIMFHCTFPIYYTLRFCVPYLSLLARPITIFVYGPVVYGPAELIVIKPVLPRVSQMPTLTNNRATRCYLEYSM